MIEELRLRASGPRCGGFSYCGEAQLRDPVGSGALAMSVSVFLPRRDAHDRQQSGADRVHLAADLEVLAVCLGDLACGHLVGELSLSVEEPSEQAVELVFLPFQLDEPDGEMVKVWELVGCHAV